MKGRLAITLLVCNLVISFCSFGQAKSGQNEVDAYKEEVEKLISFVQYIFNALGSEELSVQDKDVIVNESYLKAFRDSKVQIEDDLTMGRRVVTNKDVQAYLKDIDFFFVNCDFNLRIEDIREGINGDGNLFFRVKLNRTLTGETIEGDTINNNLTRYVEINLDKKNKDLRVASIYTTKIAEREELVNWWTSLPLTWKNLLGENIVAYDNFMLSEVSIVNDTSYAIGGMVFGQSELDIAKAIKKASSIEKLDLSNRKEIMDIEAVDGMSELKELDISNTSVSSLFPLRNLNSLEKLNVSGTVIDGLEPLVYCIRLKDLNISNTNFSDISPLSNLKNLETFRADNVAVGSWAPIAYSRKLTLVSAANNAKLLSADVFKSLVGINFLNISGTAVSDLKPINGMSNLETLDISNTKVSSLEAVSGLKSLENISMMNTLVSSLSPLLTTSVKKIFCDGSPVKQQEIVDFLKEKPSVEIIFQTQDLENWWNAVPEIWKKIVFSKVEFEGDPTPEVLHKIIKIDTVNISGHKEIENLQPLEKLLLLRKLNCSKTSVTSLQPLNGKTSLEELDFSYSNVTDLSPLKSLSNLKTVSGSFTHVADISAFANFQKLETLYFDNSNVKDVSVINSLPSFKAAYFDVTHVSDDDVIELNYDGENAVVVYKTERLREWWGNLTDDWQDMFRKSLDFSKRPSREDIHKLTGLKKFVVKSILVKDISVMSEFIRLRELKFNDTQISNISSLSKMKRLEVLDCSRNPISSLSPLSELRSLRILYAESTQIDAIDAVQNLVLLEELKFSGTEVKDLRPLEKLVNLKVLEFSNTRIKNIKPIMELFQLKELKCYNNNINSKRIDEFKEQHPQCEVVFY